jgi:hypothetical protein
MLHTRFKAEPSDFVIGSGENPISTYQRLSFFRVSFGIRNLDKSDFTDQGVHNARLSKSMASSRHKTAHPCGLTNVLTNRNVAGDANPGDSLTPITLQTRGHCPEGHRFFASIASCLVSPRLPTHGRPESPI